MTPPTLTIAIVAPVVLGVGLVLLWAPSLSHWLVRRRASGLPSDLAERLLEEWESELDHFSSGVAQLTFALQLLLTRQQTLIDAANTDAGDGESQGVVLSIDDLRVPAGPQDVSAGGVIDAALLMVTPMALLMGHVTPVTLWLATMGWNLLWILVVHVAFVSFWEATPGLLYAGVRIVTVDGSPLEWRRILRRATYLSVWIVLVLPAVLGFTLWAYERWDDRWFISFNLFCFVIASLLRVFGKQALAQRSSAHAVFGTALVMKIPHVAGRTARGPTRSTSAMR